MIVEMAVDSGDKVAIANIKTEIYHPSSICMCVCMWLHKKDYLVLMKNYT